MYAFARYLRDLKNRWFIATFIGYFLLCQSYYMFYVSTFLMFFALQFKLKRYKIARTALLTIPPIASLGLVFLQLAWWNDSMSDAFRQLTHMASFRAADVSFNGADFNARAQHVNSESLFDYPRLLTVRIRDMMGLSVPTFAAATIAAVVMAGRYAWRRHGWLLIASLAGLSWNLIMVQHTHIHGFSAMFGWFLWALLIGTFFDELYRALRPELAARVFAAVAIPTCIMLFHQPYYEELKIYFWNIVT